MSESEGEAAARSVALEQAYVHEVYEQCAGKSAQSRHWPRIYKFLEELEPGALVCDIGCGNGKYLNINNSIFKIGADRCKRLTNIARQKQNEVLLCDNLALPFRDESFDAVLSIAVVHHFATTERRVNALKELARVLRIGGKLVISVWAMEQKHRKFESQDVLVPWPKAYCLNSTCNCGTKFSCIDDQRDYPTQKCILKSKTDRQKCKNRRYWIDPIFSPSPSSTSSLSSPNETCYSFFRRAFQKLAGGKRHSGNRPWFLDSLHGDGCKNRHHHLDTDDNSDVDDIPIELRRLENESVTILKGNDSLSIKSKSLGDIVEIQRSDIVRSRSSIPGLCSTVTPEVEYKEKAEARGLVGTSKPRLVKQKSHMDDEESLDESPATAICDLIEDLPELRVSSNTLRKRGNVCKQSSMNEELMSMERLAEREHVRRHIMKQASLNEEMLRKNETFENLKDSTSSASSRRFQLLTIGGLTNRIKQSTTNSMEKVASISIKNGFVKILQSWKSDVQSQTNNSQEEKITDEVKQPQVEEKLSTPPAIIPKKEPEIERRLSREDGSDSSKDSSLQSDTSVDSEDSFASVIYVPKKEIPSSIDVTTSTTTTTPTNAHQLRTTSAPPSPRVKHPPDLHVPRFKLISISPLLKQFPATSKSLPPPSPPGLSPRTINSSNLRPFFNNNNTNNTNNSNNNNHNSTVDNLDHSFDKLINSNPEITPKPTGVADTQPIDNNSDNNKSPELENHDEVDTKTDEQQQPSPEITNTSTPSVIADENSMNSSESSPLLSTSQDTLVEKSSSETNEDEVSRKMRLHQIKELLKQKPGFATRCSKPVFPLVRRASTATSGRLETVARTLPRLLSLELFNPETDDLDSDSSGISSPESGDSVISVISDERFIVKKNGTLVAESKIIMDKKISDDKKLEKNSNAKKIENNTAEIVNKNDEVPTSSVAALLSSSPSSRLLEAAANVASSLEDTVERVIKSGQTESKENSGNSSALPPKHPSVIKSLIKKNEERERNTIDDHTWNEECRRDLIDFTDKLSENLMNDIDQYCQKKRLELSNDIEFILTDQTRRNSDILPCKSHEISINSKKIGISNSKYNELVDNTIAWLKNSTGDQDFSEYDNKLPNAINNTNEPASDNKTTTTTITQATNKNNLTDGDSEINRDESDMDFVIVSDTGEIEENVIKIENNTLIKSKTDEINDKTRKDHDYINFNSSLECSDIGDSIEITPSVSDDSSNTRRLCSPSTVSLESTPNIEYKNLKEKRSREYGQRRSVSEDTTDDNNPYDEPKYRSNFSESSSQESLPSDREGGAITYHQYYHVFREGELDQLINKYVENLHIISSYYDHANWCIVAEKVQVWTI